MFGKADFVMANPPFNVDEVDAEKIKNDLRLPFGLPGVNKKGTPEADRDRVCRCDDVYSLKLLLYSNSAL